jgi:hypothetical protein
MGEIRNTFQFLVGKYQWRVPFGVLRCRWKDDIKMDIKEIVLILVWIHGAWVVCGLCI